jgi:hypothetical protein
VVKCKDHVCILHASACKARNRSPCVRLPLLNKGTIRECGLPLVAGSFMDTGCGLYPGLSDERRGATPLQGGIVLHIVRQLLKMCFPKLVCRSPRHWRERGEGANGGQGFPKVVHALGSQVRATGHHCSSMGSSLFPCRADAGAHSAYSLELDEWRSVRLSSILAANSASLTPERLRCGGVLSTLASRRGSVWLGRRRLHNTRGGRCRGRRCRRR